MACHERYCASRSPGGMATSGRAMAAASTAMKMTANRRRRGWKTATDKAASGKSLTAAPMVMLTAAPTGRRASNATNARTISAATRSEEHTSELQSQSNLVCRLLLEKKENKTQ